MRRPDFVDRDFARLLVHAHFGNLRCVGIRWRWTDPRAFVLAATRFWWRSIGAGSGECAVEINSCNDGLLECHPVLRAFVFALLLQRTAQYLPFDPAASRSLGMCGAGALAPEISPVNLVIAEHQLVRRALHLSSRSRGNLLLHFFCGT